MYCNQGKKQMAVQPDRNMTDTHPAPEHHQGSIGQAVDRGIHGVRNGAYTGSLIAAFMAGGALLADALVPGISGAASLFHVDSLAGAATFLGVHATGAAAFEGYNEAREGYEGLGDQDTIKHTGETIAHDLKAVGTTLEQELTKAEEPDVPSPDAPHASYWRNRIAAEQRHAHSIDGPG